MNRRYTPTAGGMEFSEVVIVCLLADCTVVCLVRHLSDCCNQTAGNQRRQAFSRIKTGVEIESALGGLADGTSVQDRFAESALRCIQPIEVKLSACAAHLDPHLRRRHLKTIGSSLRQVKCHQ